MNINPADVCFFWYIKNTSPNGRNFYLPCRVARNGEMTWNNTWSRPLRSSQVRLSCWRKSPNGLRFLECFKVDGSEIRLTVEVGISHYFQGRFVHPQVVVWEFSPSTVWRIRDEYLLNIWYLFGHPQLTRSLKYWLIFKHILDAKPPDSGSSCVSKDVEDLFWSGSWLHGDVRKLAATWKLSNLRLRYAKCCFSMFFTDIWHFFFTRHSYI